MSRNIKIAAFIAILCAFFLLWVNGIGWIMLAIRSGIDVDWLRWIALIPSIAVYFGFTVVYGVKFIIWTSQKLGL